MRFLAALSFFFLLHQNLFSQYKSEPFKQALESGVATLYVHYVDVPFFVQKKNEKIEGINVDIFTDFTKYLKEKRKIAVTLKWEDNSDDFKAMYENIKNSTGAVFGMGSIIGTEERKKEIGVTKSYITIYNVLVSHNDVPSLKAIEDISTVFKGFTAFTMKGSLMEKSLSDLKNKYFSDMTIKSYASLSEVNAKTCSEEKSFAYFLLPHYIEAIKNGKPLKRHVIADTEALPVTFITSKNNEWNTVFSEFLSADGGYTNSQRYKNILMKHMGETGIKLLKMGIN
jgi:hypothetical protein